MMVEIRDQRSEIRTSGSGEFESTLRLIARISAPEGLEERVQAGLRVEASAASGKARILRWPEALRLNYTKLQNLAWVQNLARTAAAAAIVAVVVGGGWGISSHFHPALPSSAVAVPSHNGGQGGFSSAGAMRTPQTLNGPVVTHPVTAAPEKAKPAIKTPARRGKPTATKKIVVKPSAPAVK
ncbi:MAG TPA: hypothetical protein VKF63_10320 [Terracidiphilus sp.]|nr:hypothetical protein [Terracidiphilus sp.]